MDRDFPSTQLCSDCRHRTGPRGLPGLSVRQWTCSNCGTTHDRDINSGRNLKTEGRRIRAAMKEHHAPAEAAGVSGAILQMAQRIAAAVGVSALSGVYLRATAGGGGHRSAYLYASLVCAALAGLAVLASVLAGRATAREAPTDAAGAADPAGPRCEARADAAGTAEAAPVSRGRTPAR